MLVAQPKTPTFARGKLMEVVDTAIFLSHWRP